MTLQRNPEATCATCPYWADRYLRDGKSGWCAKYAPDGRERPKYRDEFCGEHPDFELPGEEAEDSPQPATVCCVCGVSGADTGLDGWQIDGIRGLEWCPEHKEL